jgi:hypothetical protein
MHIYVYVCICIYIGNSSSRSGMPMASPPGVNTSSAHHSYIDKVLFFFRFYSKKKYTQ